MTYEEDDDDIVLSATTVGKSSFDLPAITNSVSQILQAIGEDPAREAGYGDLVFSIRAVDWRLPRRFAPTLYASSRNE